jgi:Zn-dependent protease with chaperone function
MRQRTLLVILGVAVWSTACASLPVGTYYPSHTDPNTLRVANILHRAAVAAGDDPTRYGFSFIKSQHAAAYTDEDATFYITDGLARLPNAVLEAAVAHEVAHEVLDHIGTRQRLALSLNAGFGMAGIFAPGVGLLDFVVNPLLVRAFSRQQELAADQRAIEILRAMGNPTPRRSLYESLRVVDAVLVRTRDEGGSVLDTHPTLKDRLKALEPLEPAAVAEAPGKKP